MTKLRGITSQAECIDSLGSQAFRSESESYCNATWDTILCWPATEAGTTVALPCPSFPGLDPDKFSYRTCGPEGLWEGKYPGDYSIPIGYSNYTDCYTPEAMELYKVYLGSKTSDQKQLMKDIIYGTRMMDVVGLWLSLISSLLSLFIFSYFRGLYCHRTRIHRNLFVAIIVQICIRLVVYVDQFIARMHANDGSGHAHSMSGAIYDTPILCEVLHALLEYTKSVQFMWMLIEGIYLHNQIAVSVFSKKPNYFVFYAIGWASPLPFTIVWCITMTLFFKSKCWYPYYFAPWIWIIEVPRIAVIIINLLFLLNIIRILVLKLQDSHHTNEAQYIKVRKAIKAALLLLPLLGITNFVVMIKSPADPIMFGIWSYSSHFLVSFQGLLISILYCFMNGEVQQTIKKRWNRFRQRHLIHTSSVRRLSHSVSMFTSVSEVPHPQTRLGNTTHSHTRSYATPLLRNSLIRRESEM